MTRVGPVDPDRFDDFFGAMGVPFSFDPTPDGMAESREFWDASWLSAAYDGDDIVATFGSFPLDMRLPGGATVKTGGTTIVAVLPTHRRQGVLTALMRDHLDRERANGSAMAALWASEPMIYGRFGYGIASDDWQLTLPRQHAVLTDPVDVAGRVRLLSADEAATTLPPIFDAAHAQRPGVFARTDHWWRRRILHDPERHRSGYTAQRIAVIARDGIDVGYARWRTKGGPDGLELRVGEAVGVDPDAARGMWQFLFGIDLVEEIKVAHSPADLPLRWWLRNPRKLERKETDALWVRPLDLKGCLEGRSYASDGSIVLEVDDPWYGDVAGRWRLVVDGGIGTAERTSDPADVALGVDAVGTLLLGGFGAETLAGAGRIAGDSSAVRVTDRLFHWPIAPWVQEVF